MSEPNDQVDELIGNVLADDVPDHVHQRLRSQLVDFQTKLGERQNRPFQWSKRRIWLGVSVTAAAALILSLIVVNLRPQVSFADVIAAVQRLPWVHVSIIQADGEMQDVWYSANDDISASRNKNWLEFHDHRSRIYYSYDVSEKVLYRVPEFTPRRADEYALVAEALRLVLRGQRPADKPLENLEFLGPEGAKMELLEQTVNRVEEGGQQWLDYRLTVRYPEVPDLLHLLFRVDPKTMLPRLCRVEGKRQGKPVTIEQRIDYPERGPTSVYELGVPQTTKLVDRVPSDDIVRILETIRAGRQRMDDYRAIVVSRMHEPDGLWWINEQPMIFYRKGDMTRVDYAGWTGDFPVVDKPADNADMEEWWRNRAQDFTFCPFYITNGSTQYLIHTQPVKGPDGVAHLQVKSVERTEINSPPGEAYPPYYSRSPEFVCRPPLGIPQQAFEPLIETAPTEGPVGTVLLRVVKSGRAPGMSNLNPKESPHQPDVYRFWLDPKRDYVVLRWDMLGVGASEDGDILASTVIEELKQSPHGVWYATRFRVKAVPPVEHDEVFSVYINFDAELPDSLFDPPVVGQVISR